VQARRALLQVGGLALRGGKQFCKKPPWDPGHWGEEEEEEEEEKKEKEKGGEKNTGSPYGVLSCTLERERAGKQGAVSKKEVG